MPTEPTDLEQYALELVNRLRLDPTGSFDRFIADAATGTAHDPGVTAALAWFFVDLDALAAQLGSLTAVAPLAWNGLLHDAAAGHNAAMQAADEQSHQVEGEAPLGARVDATGYLWTTLAENVYAYSENPDHAHAGFVIDWGYDTGESTYDRAGGDGIQDPAGHRNALMSANYSEIGIDWLADSSGLTSVGPWLTTQVLGTAVFSGPKVLGVVYADADADGAYSMGEGAAAAISIAAGAPVAAQAAGGYSLDANIGVQRMAFSGGGLERDIELDVTVVDRNVKIDVTADGFIASSGDVAVQSWAAGLKALSHDGVELRGGHADELIEGGRGDDDLFGGRGADRIQGGKGFDTIWGGGFSDGLSGGTEGDEIHGGRGWDRIYGGQGDDQLYGDEGNDFLAGGAGRDRIEGGDGDDRLRGGRGADTFVFDASDGTDRIEDWEAKDRINLRPAGVELADIMIGTSGDDAVLAFAATTVIIENAAGIFSEADLLLA
ncbi:CAP domain-containing protein [Rhodovulum sp. DZ06]|uniref:CAP domain-containing protein n=1 Tax=Rhodovulum sp. DZ06 TaxID=3425126 RepID=UPI003D32AA15